MVGQKLNLVRMNAGSKRTLMPDYKSQKHQVVFELFGLKEAKVVPHMKYKLLKEYDSLPTQLASKRRVCVDSLNVLVSFLMCEDFSRFAVWLICHSLKEN